MHELPMSLTVTLTLLGGAAIVVTFILNISKKEVSVSPYQRQSALFTPAERSFLGALDSALGTQFRIFGKVRLADIIKVKPGLSKSVWQQAFNKIQSKHLDFIACDPKDLSVQFVIELDDTSHQKSHRQNRDEFIGKALEAAAVPIFRFSAKRTYSVQDIRNQIFTQLTATAEPKV